MHRATAARSCAFLATAVLLAIPSTAQAQEVERFTLSGNALAVYNLAGTVRVERGTAANVIVEVRRGGRDADRLEIERRTVDGRSALVVRYPSGDVVYSGPGRSQGQTTLRVRDDGTFYGGRDGGDRVEIRSRGRGTEAHADLRILVPAGRSLQVLLGVGSIAASGIEGDLSFDVGAAPVQTSDTRGRLHIDTGSGRVTVRDAQGDLLVDTGSGSVALAGVRGSSVHVDTGSGSVDATDVRAEDVLVDTGSGAVSMAAVAARDVEIDTGSGRVDLELLTDIERLVIDTGSGGVRLAVPEGLGAEFEIEASRVRIDVPASLRESDRDHARGTLGDGRGTISIDTGSGPVSLIRRQ